MITKKALLTELSSASAGTKGAFEGAFRACVPERRWPVCL